MRALAAVAFAVGLSGGSTAVADVVGSSAEGRPIDALRVGSPRAERVVLVVGEIHGSEPAGRAVVRRLGAARPPRGTALLLVDTANPDGGRRGRAGMRAAST